MSPNPVFVNLISSAAQALKERVDEVNKLNVFPVPDGDTGTNMSLTMDAVNDELAKLDADADLATICHSVTHGSLMGARGNSGVILSQVLRGLCEVIAEAETFDTDLLSRSLARSTEVAFQAVRKPVEGTMLTVLKDAAKAAKGALRAKASLDDALDAVVKAAFESVRRTPELLPVLKENGVVDAGGYGLAILAEGILAAYRGQEVVIEDVSSAAAPLLTIEPADDWDDQEYLYCTEFLLFGDGLDREEIHDYVAAQGGSELVVGEDGMFKVHVHTDHPGAVLAHMTGIGEVAEVHINNMRRQSAERSEGLREGPIEETERPYGIVTVAAGEGIKDILASLGADTIVNGGQTMNPSTAELLAAAEALNAAQVILLPNNKNIHMAANQAAEHSDRPIGVVPTRTVPEAFAALLAFDPDASLQENVAAMSDAASAVRTGEVTTAIKDSKGKVGAIKTGQFIGIADHEIEVVGDDLHDVAVRLAEFVLGDGETLTLLAGEDLSDEDLDRLVADLSAAHPDVEVEPHRGGQPLYPLILSAE